MVADTAKKAAMDYMTKWDPNWRLSQADHTTFLQKGGDMMSRGMETTSELLSSTLDKLSGPARFFYTRIFDQPVMTQISRSIAMTFAIQLLGGFLPHALLGSERHYYLLGGLNFLLVTAFTLFTQPDWGLRKVIVSAMVSVWATRLMTHLFVRSRTYLDKRFAAIRGRPLAKFIYWTGQAIWVASCMIPVIILNSEDTPRSAYSLPGASLPKQVNTPVGTLTLPGWLGKVRGPARHGFWGTMSYHNLTWLDFAGFAMWGLGFAIECIADYQKQRFYRTRANKEDQPFIKTGLWRFSRHPNYLGEIMMWCGIYLSCLNVIHGWQHLAIFSPLLTAFTILAVSGVPLSEDSKNRQFGGLPEYQQYKKATPLLAPFLF